MKPLLKRVFLVVLILLFVSSCGSGEILTPGNYYSSELVEGVKLNWVRTLDFTENDETQRISLENLEITVMHNVSNVLVHDDSILHYFKMFNNDSHYGPRQIERELGYFIMPVLIVTENESYSLYEYYKIYAELLEVTIRRKKGNIIIEYYYLRDDGYDTLDVIVDEGTGIIETRTQYSYRIFDDIVFVIVEEINFMGGLEITETSFRIGLFISIILIAFLKRKEKEKSTSLRLNLFLNRKNYV